MIRPGVCLRFIFLLSCLVTACSHTPVNISPTGAVDKSGEKGEQVVIFALGLIDIDYRFGGKNPQSGLDCSGMVAYIYKNTLGLELPTNAQQIANLARRIEKTELRPGDLVFFNTLHRAYSHVGIYIGDDRFVHSPGTNGKIKISNLKSIYYARTFQTAATLLR